MGKEDRYCLNNERLRVEKMSFEHSSSECTCNHHHHHHHHDDSCCCNHHSHGKKEKIVLLIRTIVSVILLVLAFIFKGIISDILLGVSYIIISYDILFNAFKNIVKGKVFDENFLMSLASLTALIVYYVNKEIGIDGFDGVLVMILYQVGEFLQHFASDKSKASIEKLIDLNVDSAIKLENGVRSIIDVKDIKIDDVLLIKPGETIPTDGIVVYGTSSLNASSLTGESKPLDVSVGDKVLSGCINNDGLIHIKAITKFEESTSSKVKKIVLQASKNKAKHERFITRFAKVYTPIVILISLIVMFLVPLFLGFEKHFAEYLYKGLSIMVISCPCALVISVPLSYFMGIGRCAKNGILVKGSNYLELLSNINHIAFDKTGTLTNGTLKVSKIVSENEELLNFILYNTEKNLTHPISTSITSYLKDKVEEKQFDDVINISGLGVKAKYQEKEILIGNERLIKNNNIKVNNINEIGTIIHVIYDGKYLGYVLLKDSIKSEAYNVIKSLKQSYNISLISGDSENEVKEVANELAIENYYYSMLPDGKEKIVKEIKEKENVLYVGDGINDAACMLSATTSIAMKSLGSEVAINASDMVIMDDRISSVNMAIIISKKTMKIVKQNIIGSILIKVLVMGLALIIHLPMFAAIIADVGLCLLAVLNSLRIMYGKIR